MQAPSPLGLSLPVQKVKGLASQDSAAWPLFRRSCLEHETVGFSGLSPSVTSQQSFLFAGHLTVSHLEATPGKHFSRK